MPPKLTLFIVLTVAALFAVAFAEPVAAPAPSVAPAAPGAAVNTAPGVNAVPVAPEADEDAEAVSTEATVPAAVPQTSPAHAKYVAVVETDVDIHSGAADELTRADVRLVTAELRREAVKNLPRGRYNVMTSETVMAQGSATLVDCSEENCVIALGSRIGADFIVRGTISKMDTRYTLSVEIYDTEDGNLVGSSDPVRSESVGGLVENAAAACAEMYRTFAKTEAPAAVPVPVPVPIPVPPTTWEVAAPPLPPPPPKPKSRASVVAGLLFASDFGGGATWDAGEIGMPSYAGGAYLSFDISYAAIFFAYSQGGAKWTSPNNTGPHELPYMSRSSVTVGVSAKYPGLIRAGLSFAGMERCISLYPTLELGYEMPVAAKLEYASQPEYVFDGHSEGGYAANALRTVWVKIGGGLDLDLSQNIYLRAEALYGARTPNWFETDNSKKPRLGHGLTVKGGAGVRI
jgi:hypothetical protein